MNKIKIQIKNRWTGDILFEYSKENNTIKDTLNKAIECKADLRKADLNGANLYEANLYEANLYGADLRKADLNGANLYGACLHKANLNGVNLYGAYLYGARLYKANLNEANLYGADLRKADLNGADLNEANLNEANLNGANLNEANLNGANLSETERNRLGKIITKEIIVYKKCHNKIIELELQKGSIVFSINNYKCRTNQAKVISIDGDKTRGLKIASSYDSDFIYEVGKTVQVKDFNLMYNVECATGIHFFYDINDAINYKY